MIKEDIESVKKPSPKVCDRPEDIESVKKPSPKVCDRPEECVKPNREPKDKLSRDKYRVMSQYICMDINNHKIVASKNDLIWLSDVEAELCASKVSKA